MHHSIERRGMWGHKAFEMWPACLFSLCMTVEIFCPLFKNVCARSLFLERVGQDEKRQANRLIS